MAPHTTEYNEDELKPPNWLNHGFLEKVLQNCEKTKKIELKNFEITPASAKGDHYASVMFRISVDYNLDKVAKSKSLILKTMPETEGNKKEMIGESLIFETEIAMYTEVIPKFEKILREIGDDTVLGSPCLNHSLSPKKVIVFEDICPLGYNVLRDRTPNLEEVKAAYGKLAKWHAISYKLHLENPHTFDKIKNGVFTQKAFADSEMFKDGITNFIEILECHEDLRKYVPYFEPFVGKVVDECVKTQMEAYDNPQNDGIYVLIHGDFHHKNMMFKHDSKTKEFKDVMLLDFQMSYVGPVAYDILYGLFMILNRDLRRHNLDEVLYHYFTTFQETLRKIGFKAEIPKMFQFRQQLMRHKNFYIFMVTSMLPLWEAIHKAKVDIDELITNAKTRRKMYDDPEYLDEIREILPKLLYTGILEN